MLRNIIDRIEQVDYLIRSKSTGTPTALAKRLGISKRAIYYFIELMKSLGASISYSKFRQSYYYKERGKFDLHFQKERIADQEGSNEAGESPKL